MSKLCLSAKISVLGPTPSYPNNFGQYRGTFSLQKMCPNIKNIIVKKKNQLNIFSIKISRENTTLLMLNFRATLANVRKNKIYSR